MGAQKLSHIYSTLSASSSVSVPCYSFSDGNWTSDASYPFQLSFENCLLNGVCDDSGPECVFSTFVACVGGLISDAYGNLETTNDLYLYSPTAVCPEGEFLTGSGCGTPPARGGNSGIDQQQIDKEIEQFFSNSTTTVNANVNCPSGVPGGVQYHRCELFHPGRAGCRPDHLFN